MYIRLFGKLHTYIKLYGVILYVRLFQVISVSLGYQIKLSLGVLWVVFRFLGCYACIKLHGAISGLGFWILRVSLGCYASHPMKFISFFGMLCFISN